MQGRTTRTLLALVALIFLAGGAAAQTVEISGTVTDTTGGVLPGASVAVVGTSVGTSTGPDGGYSLNAPSSADSLSFSFVGYEPRQVAIDGRTQIDVQLRASAVEAEEVVVVGYGSTPKSDLTGSVSSVDAASIQNVPAVRVDQLLQGQASGTFVTSTSGAPGAETTIRIRGGNSINAGNEPLYVIDGVIGAGDLNSLNPNDIESIEVLKDASATSIYGSRGANGVVLITTKRGREGGDQISVNFSRGWQTLPDEIDMMNPVDYARLVNDMDRRNGNEISYPNPEAVDVNTNWQDEVTRTAPETDLQLSARGGGEGFRYYLSGNYLDQRGIIRNSGLRRYQFRVNLGKDFSDRFTVRNVFNISRTQEDNNTVALGGYDYSGSALATPSLMPIYNEDGELAYDQPYVSFPVNNPVAQATLPLDETGTTNILGNLVAEYELLDGLTLSSTLGVDANHTKSDAYQPGTLPTRRINEDGGAAAVTSFQRYTILNENTVNLNRTFGEQHQIDAVAGFTYQTSTYESLNGSASEFTNDVTTYNNLTTGAPDTRDIGSAYESWTILSGLGRVNYTLQDRYLFTLSGRYDGSSRLAANNKWAFFPSAALGWRISEEPFFDVDLFSNLKVRGSFGYTGNQGVEPYSTIATLTATNYVFNDQETSAFVAGQLPNPNLRWETTRQLDLGLEAGFFDGRLNMELGYYDKQTDDLILQAEVPWQTGYASRLQNIGTVTNRGVELSVNSSNVVTDAFLWETNFNISANRNRVDDLGEVDEIITYRYNYGNRPLGILREGEPVGAFYGAIYEGPWQSEAEIEEAGTMPGVEPGDPRYRDVNGDGTFDQSDYTTVGNATPSFFGGVGNTFSYSNWELNAFLQFSYGNDIVNGSDGLYGSAYPQFNQYAEVADRWTPDNRDTDIPRVGSNDYVPSTRWVHDGSFLRLKTLRLTYNLPTQRLGLGALRQASLSVIGTNLLLWDSYNGYDPEVSSFDDDPVLRGYDFAAYPRSRTITVGINVGL